MKKTKVCIELALPFAPGGSLLRELRSVRGRLRDEDFRFIRADQRISERRK